MFVNYCKRRSKSKIKKHVTVPKFSFTRDVIKIIFPDNFVALNSLNLIIGIMFNLLFLLNTVIKVYVSYMESYLVKTVYATFFLSMWLY